MDKLKSGLVYFGGKSIIAPKIWEKVGIVENFVEPFCGSAAVLLANPSPPKIETINDKDCLVTNFWRAIKNDQEKVCFYAVNPVNEIDMHARHQFILNFVDENFINRMEQDPDFFDSKIAGWWAWGLACSVGNNWLQKKGLSALPHLSTLGQGINGANFNAKDMFSALAERLKRTRIVTGDWSRICTPTVTYKNTALSKDGVTFVFLDPPYNLLNRTKVYKEDNNVFKLVEDWCKENESQQNLKIAICGYDGDYDLPGWEKLNWKSNGGYSSLGENNGKENSKKETIWFKL